MSEAEQPFFTVAVPTYNRRGFLESCLAHLCRQSFADFEIVVSDNCSTDDTPGFLANYPDPRVRSVRQPRNLIAMQNFRAVAEEARGRYLVVHQDDDLLHRDFLARAHAALTREPGVVAYASAWWRGHESFGFKSLLPPEPGSRSIDWIMEDEVLLLDGRRVALAYLHRFPWIHPAMAFDAAVFRELGGYPLGIEGTEDLMATVKVFSQGKVAIDPRPLAVYRDHAENYSHVLGRNFKRLGRAQLYTRIVGHFDQLGFDWEAALAEDLASMTRTELEEAADNWATVDAPDRLHRLLWAELRKRSPGAMKLGKMLVWKLGVKRTLQLVRRTFFGGPGYDGPSGACPAPGSRGSLG